MYRPAAIAGSLLAALGIMLGAFGAHALRQVLDAAQLQVFETGVRYQMYHSFALLFTGIAYQFLPGRQLRIATAFFITGIVLFSGSLYAMTLLQIRGQVGLGGLGILTPIGGLFFIAAWLLLLAALLRKR